MDDEQLPGDPLTVVDMMAAQHHEAFLAWTRAGFSEQQALELVKSMIAATILRPG